MYTHEELTKFFGNYGYELEFHSDYLITATKDGFDVRLCIEPGKGIEIGYDHPPRKKLSTVLKYLDIEYRKKANVHRSKNVSKSAYDALKEAFKYANIDIDSRGTYIQTRTNYQTGNDLGIRGRIYVNDTAHIEIVIDNGCEPDVKLAFKDFKHIDHITALAKSVMGYYEMGTL